MKKIFAIFLVIGSLLLVGAVYLIIQQNVFINNSQNTTGIVIDYKIEDSEDSKGKRSRYYYPIIVFIDQSGKKIEFKSSLGTGSPNYQVGEKVEVLYDPNNSSDASINSFMSMWFSSIIVSIFGSIFFLIGLIFFIIMRKKSNKKRELLNNGRRVEATISSVEFNHSLKVNGRSPYVIYSQWVDPFHANSIYIFKSDNIWFNPEAYITKKTISVFIDEKNPHRYYVDISFLPKIK